jgi:hypothetical protein
MADAFDPTDPRHLTPEQRLDELTAILATGVRRALSLRAAGTPPESEQIRLDVSPQTSVHVPVQLTQPESREGVEA